MALTETTPAQAPAGVHSTTEITAATLPVSSWAQQTFRTLSRVIVPVSAGDVLDIDARARVTNDVGYNTGIGYHLWAYDLDDQGSSGPWWRISPFNGDNVDPQRHHMPLHCTAVYRVPSSWPAGHRIVVVYRGDAHSTAARAGDAITVDGEYGVLTVRRWTEEA